MVEFSVDVFERFVVIIDCNLLSEGEMMKLHACVDNREHFVFFSFSYLFITHFGICQGPRQSSVGS